MRKYSISQVVKAERMRWSSHILRMLKNIHARRMLMGGEEMRKSIGRRKNGCEATSERCRELGRIGKKQQGLEQNCCENQSQEPK